MFASLGFKVDASGLNSFKTNIISARTEMKNLGRGVKNTTSQLRGLRRELGRVDTQLGKIKGGAANTRIKQAYNDIASSVRRLDTALNSITRNRPATTKAIGKINSSVFAGIPHWDRYRESVVRTRIALRNLNGDLARLRANSRIDIRINQNGGGAGGRGNGGGGSGALGGAAAGLGLRGFLGNMLPAMALSGGGAAVGFGGKAMVETARDQTRMESMLLMTSKSGEEFARTLQYVRGEAERLGLSSTELGKSFAQINMSAQGMSQNTKEKMFTGFSEFMMSMGTSADDQKGIFRAFNQMFSNNRILQEEINQLSDRGIPATLVYDAAMKAYDTTNIQKIKKLQEDGKLDPKRVLPIMAEMVQKLAHDSGSYAKMMESSIVKQGKFYEQLRQTSKNIMDSGLDEFLGKIFGLLTEIVVKIEDASVAIKQITTSVSAALSFFNDWTNGSKLLWLSLYILIFRFKAFVKGAAVAARVLAANGSVMTALAAIFRGVFGRAIGGAILKFGAWGLAIWAVTEALQFLGKELTKSQAGKWSFFDEIFFGAEKAGAQVSFLLSRLQGAMLNMKAMARNPIDLLTFDSADSVLSPITLETKRPSKTPNRNLGGDIGNMVNQGSLLKNLDRQNSPVPFRNSNTTGRVVGVTLPIVIQNRDGSSTREEQYFNIMV